MEKKDKYTMQNIYKALVTYYGCLNRIDKADRQTLLYLYPIMDEDFDTSYLEKLIEEEITYINDNPGKDFDNDEVIEFYDQKIEQENDCINVYNEELEKKDTEELRIGLRNAIHTKFDSLKEVVFGYKLKKTLSQYINPYDEIDYYKKQYEHCVNALKLYDECVEAQLSFEDYNRKLDEFSETYAFKKVRNIAHDINFANQKLDELAKKRYELVHKRSSAAVTKDLYEGMNFFERISPLGIECKWRSRHYGDLNVSLYFVESERNEYINKHDDAINEFNEIIDSLDQESIRIFGYPSDDGYEPEERLELYADNLTQLLDNKTQKEIELKSEIMPLFGDVESIREEDILKKMKEYEETYNCLKSIIKYDNFKNKNNVFTDFEFEDMINHAKKSKGSSKRVEKVLKKL